MKDLLVLLVHLLTTIAKLLGPGGAKAIVEMKQRNPRFGCPRIAQQINEAFGTNIDKDVVRRVIGFGVHAGNVDGVALCRMFNNAISNRGVPKYLSSDNDPLFQYHQWQANLRILDVDELKSIPYTPRSHPFIERLIGTIRREFLDHTLFWSAADLGRKLEEFRQFYNAHRVHTALEGNTPSEITSEISIRRVTLNQYRWKAHCHGLFQLPSAA